MKSILVTAIGSYAAKLAVCGLKKNGYRVIGTDIYPGEWVAEAKNVDRFHQVPKAVDETAFREAMLEICREDSVSGILPLTDVEIDFFQNNGGIFEDAGVLLYLSPTETIARCRDKMRLTCFVDENCPSVQTIPTAWTSDYTGVAPAFPVICKIVDGRSSQGLYRIRDGIDWEYFQKREDASRYLVQPMIEGSVIAVDCLRDREGHVVTIPREELLRTLNGAGTSVCVYYDEALEIQCAELANALGTLGCVCFEFIRDAAGSYHFLECNARFGGGSIFSEIAGYDVVTNHLRAFRGEPIDQWRPSGKTTIARRYEEYVMKTE